MEVFDKIIDQLKSKKIEFEVIEHEPVHTSADAARVRDTGLENGAKALVFIANKSPILVVLPGDKKVDTKTFKNLFSIKDLSMATKDQVKELTTLEVGSIPPTGSVLGLKTYFDESFKQKEYSVFNAGSLTLSVKMRTIDLLDIEKPIFGNYAV